MSLRSPLRILNYRTSLLLALLPSLLLVAFVLLVGMPVIQSQQAQLRANDLAQAKAHMLDKGFEQLYQQIDGLARLPQLRQALRDNDTEAIARMSDEYALGFGQLDQLALLPLGELGIASLGEHRDKLRNSIEKDLLRRATEQSTIGVDSYQIDGQRVVSMARAVNSGGRDIGAILLTVRADWLVAQLSVDSEQGEIPGVAEVVYAYSDGNLDVLARSASLGDFVASAGTGLAANPQLQVNYYLTAVVPVAMAAQLALVASALIVGLLAVLALMRQLAAVGSDISASVTELDAVIELGGTGEGFTHNYFANTLELIQQRPAAEAQPAANARVQEEDEVKPWANPSVAGQMDVVEDLDQPAPEPDPEASETAVALPREIFRAYDIRGHADEQLSDAVVSRIGKAIGSKAQALGHQQIVVGRDGRNSSPRIQQALLEGLLSSGIDCVDIGLLATPMMYYACEQLATQAGVMVTGSHNPPAYNGLKIVLEGQALAAEQIQELAQIAEAGSFEVGKGLLTNQDVEDAYIDQIADDVVVAASIKVVLDCGNGAASTVAPMLFASLGCDVVPLFADIDGDFPNRGPDPGDTANLQALVAEVARESADLGLAFDGDADRVVAVTASGQIVPSDQLLMLFAKDVLTRNPGADVIYDIKCSRQLNQVVAAQGGRPIMSESGHSLIKRKMRQTGALLGGEFSGHFFFKERWYGFDDGIYSGARLIELITLEGVSLDEAIAELPQSAATPEIYLPVEPGKQWELIEQLQGGEYFVDAQITTLDGVRADFPQGWGLVRASNTSAKLSLRFEADTEDDLSAIQMQFVNALEAVDSTLGAALAAELAARPAA